MAIEVTVKLDKATMDRLLRGRGGAVTQDLFRRGLRVETAAKERCPVDTGRLRSSINTRVEIRDGLPVVRIGTNVEYAAWVHNGTGIYGPHKTPIRPVRAKYLVFKPKGSSHLVAKKWVWGMKARPFLKDALRAAR